MNMIAELPAREETEFERLYSQARLHELLTREQEQEIDQRKWGAIKSILELLCQEPFSRTYLLRWAMQCASSLPDMEQFECREHRLLLRRELADYLPEGNSAQKVALLAEQCAGAADSDVILGSLLELALPATLVVGMAEVVSQHCTGSDGGKVAAALAAWEEYWPSENAAAAAAPSPAMVGSLETQIRLYTAARDLLIVHNLRLVYAIAGRNRRNGAAFLDLVQEGNLGLLRAAEKFQFERGYRFSTYAFNWITQGVKRYLGDSVGAIRYPTHVQEQLGRVHGERARLLARSGISVRDTELADALGIPIARTRELLQLRGFDLSLDAPNFEDDPGSTLLDTIHGGPFAAPGHEAEQASLNHRLLSEIGLWLNQAEQEVVTQRWGLVTDAPLSREEIARHMSLSIERVRQLEQSALKKLGQSETMRAVYRDHCHEMDEGETRL